MNNLLTVEGLKKSYGRKKVLNGISFSVSSGKVVGLLGENGIGKTTLLRTIANILKSDRGTITIDGELISLKTQKSVSFLMEPQDFYPWMKIKDSIKFYRDFYPDFDLKKAQKFCEDFNLDLNCPITKLSKGNKERVCLLLNLSRNVRLYLLDEPLGGFDPKLKKDIIKTILSNISENVTVIISTHLLKDLESIFDDVLILKNGELIYIATDEIREKHHLSVEDFYLGVVEND